MIKYLSNETLEDALTKEVTIVDFFATWCGPCKMLGSVIEELAQDRSSQKIVKIDVDECSDLAKNYGIMSVPTLIIFKDGKLIDQKTGFMSKAELVNWLESK